jgi:two-component system, response regulator PdtaR
MKKKVLIAEDEKIIALDIRRQLQKLDYEVTSIVSTGEDAINECRRKKPDVVLMDIGLQGILSGTQAATTIFNEMQIPIVHLSGLRKDLKDSDINYPLIFINKPFEQRVLKEILDKVLSS